MNNPTFVQYLLTGNTKSTDKLAGSKQFLQGQLTMNANRIHEQFTPTAICNLKGRVHFGLWIKLANDGFHIVLSADLADDFALHVKKYGAFSKIELQDKRAVYPSVINGEPTFCPDEQMQDVQKWQKLSIEQGNYWIYKDNQEKFQPQELRLHQRGGMDFDKGCYLGQEIIARLWFKSSPKAFLHHICYEGELPSGVEVVNQSIFDNQQHALVVARPDVLINHKHLSLIAFPPPLNQSVSRETNG